MTNNKSRCAASAAPAAGLHSEPNCRLLTADCRKGGPGSFIGLKGDTKPKKGEFRLAPFTAVARPITSALCWYFGLAGPSTSSHFAAGPRKMLYRKARNAWTVATV